jgi:hypothetical protein
MVVEMRRSVLSGRGFRVNAILQFLGLCKGNVSPGGAGGYLLVNRSPQNCSGILASMTTRRIDLG